MKKYGLMIVACLMIQLAASPVWAVCSAGDKLVSGFRDVFTSPFEIIPQMQEQTKDTFLPLGITAGILGGIGSTVKKAIKGTFNVLTFPVVENCDY